MVNQLFLLPYTVEYQDGSADYFAKFCEASFGGIEIEVEVNISSDPDLKIQGSISGEEENTSISFQSSLGVPSSFVYKKHSVTTTLRSGEANISIVHREFIPRNKPVISGYSIGISVGLIFIGVVTALIRNQIANIKRKKGAS
jgi:hypothetical protein